MTPKRTPNAIKYPGGQYYYANDIVKMFPPRLSPDNPNGYVHYVEAFFGGGSILFANDPEGISEVVNDLDGELTNFWRVLQNSTQFTEFKRMVEAIPFSESEFSGSVNDEALIPSFSVESAVNFFIHSRQSRAGSQKSFTPITKTRTRRGMNNEVSAWLTAIEGLPLVHERLKRVLILNRFAIQVIREQDGQKTLFVCDPPFLHETRSSPATYKYEMTNEEHQELLDTLKQCKGKVILLGYDSVMYNTALSSWNKKVLKQANHAASGDKKRVMEQHIWLNF